MVGEQEIGDGLIIYRPVNNSMRLYLHSIGLVVGYSKLEVVRSMGKQQNCLLSSKNK